MSLARFQITRWIIAGLVCAALALAGNVIAAPGGKEPSDKSDLNKDGWVNVQDLEIFSTQYLEQNYQTVNWCAFHESVSNGEEIFPQSTTFYLRHFGMLLGFIYDHYQCYLDLLAIVNQPVMLGRLAASYDAYGYIDQVFATDPKVDSVFILDSNLLVTGEIKNLDRPLGIALDSNGYLLVGNDGRDNIEVYSPSDGHLLFTFGEGLLRMPTAISIGHDGLIYVTDSQNHNIRVFDPAYILLDTIGNHGMGPGEFNFPMGTALITRLVNGAPADELYVADRNNNRIQILDQEGNYITSFTGVSFGSTKPKLKRMQAVEFDAYGRLHILDLYAERVEVIDAGTGRILMTYGAAGEGPGLLTLPADVIISPSDIALVTDGGIDDLEVFTVPVP